MKHIQISSLLYLGIFGYGAFITASTLISPKKIVLAQKKYSQNIHYVPQNVKAAVRSCITKYPELNSLIDLSLFNTQLPASQEALKELTRDLLQLLNESELKNIDPADTTIEVMQKYLHELESDPLLFDSEKESSHENLNAKRSFNLFNTNTGIALSDAGELNIYGANNIGTQGSGNTATISLNQNLAFTGAFALSSLTGGVVISSPTGVLSVDTTTNNAVQIGNATGTLTSIGVGSNGQVLLGSNGAAPFFTGLSSPANPSGAASVLYTSGASFLALQSVPLFANVIRVDWLNGNNATATVTNGLPYKTISAALTAAGAAASSVSPYVIWIMPGIYNEGQITMQSYVSVIGMSEGAGLTVTSAGAIPTTVGVSGVVIQSTVGGGSTPAIVMAEYSRLENVTVNYTNTSTTGISLSGTMTLTARIKEVTLNLRATSGNAVGITSSSTGTPGPEISVLQDCIISVTGSGSGTCGVTITAGSGNFNISNCNIAAINSSTNTCYAINNSASTILTINNSIIKCSSGIAANANDLLNASTGQIILNNTYLFDNTPNNTALTTTQNFTSTTSSLLTWSVIGTLGAGTFFLTPGALPVANVPTVEAGSKIPIVQKCSIKSLNIVTSALAGTTVFTVRQNGINSLLTQTLTNPALTGSNITGNIAFASGDLLSLQVVSATGTVTNPVVSVALY